MNGLIILHAFLIACLFVISILFFAFFVNLLNERIRIIRTLWSLGICEIAALFGFSYLQAINYGFQNLESKTIQNYPIPYAILLGVGVMLILLSLISEKRLRIQKANEEIISDKPSSEEETINHEAPSTDFEQCLNQPLDEVINDDEDDQDSVVDDDEVNIDDFINESYDSPEYKQFYDKLVKDYGDDVANQVVWSRKLLSLIVKYEEDDDNGYDFYFESKKRFYQLLADKGIQEAVNKDIIEYFGWSHIDDTLEIEDLGT